MYHYFEAITNTRGDALTGYYVQAVDQSSGNTISLYADSNSTPIISVSGVADKAKVDTNGNVSFYVSTGTYNLNIYATDSTTLVETVFGVPMLIDEDLAATVTANASAAANSASQAQSYLNSLVTMPTNGLTVTAASRTALALLGTSVPATLFEAGREGLFVFSSANHSADVTADPNQGIYVAPNSDTTGASGAWVRKFSGRVNVKWFGAVADWNGTTGTDNGAAFSAALSYLNTTAAAGTYAGGNLGLYIPKGKYWLNATTLDLTTSIIIEGDSVGEAGGEATYLIWSAGATGIRVQHNTTTGATGVQASDVTKSGAASIIRNLHLVGGYTTTQAEYYGIHLRARASIRDCYITNFQGDGIYIYADSGNASVKGNANNFEITKVIITSCRNGIWISGGDTNAGVITAADCMSNRAWGISDNSFLGNTYVACHTSGNTSGPYQTTNNNAQCVFVGCYSESGQPASSFAHPTVIIGGENAAGVSGDGAYFRNVLGTATVDAFSATSANIATINATTNLIGQSGAPLTLFSATNGGNQIVLGLNVAGISGPGILSNNTAGGGNPFTIDSASVNWIYNADGLNHFALTNAGLTLTGTISASTYTVATLPASPAVGTRAFVTDANATTFASTVAGGGTNKVPVFYDGAWKIG